jgi:transcriptional regulator with XRE-family HTH domain
MTKNILSPESIRRFREERNLSQQELATLLNIGSKSVSRWETGKAEPSGTAAAVLSVLISGITRHEEVGPVGPLASGYAIYRLLRSHFEDDAEK